MTGGASEEDDDVIALGREADAEADDGPALGPDERDMDLLDGSWEQRYYSGRERGRDWSAIGTGLALLILAALLLPAALVFFR
ncbi:MAG: hypothetical protein ACR2HN_09740 [Tepidiformaceae bacterium]